MQRSSVVFLVTICLSTLARAYPACGADGDPDATFGVSGLVLTHLAFDGASRGRALEIQSDGKIVVVGELWTSADFGVARYNTDGSLDPSFGENGVVRTDVAGSSDGAWDVAIQSDGKIVVVGESNADTALVRYNVDGTLDTSFDADGIVTTPNFGNAYAVALQADGKIVVAASGGDYGYGNFYFAVARYNTDGSLDSNFSGDGLVTTDTTAGNGNAFADDLVIQGDGKIVVAGHQFLNTTSRYSFVLVRYNANGSLDAGFGGSGIVGTTFPGATHATAEAIELQSDGKLVVAGDYWGPSHGIAVARYNLNGGLDAGFSGDGRVTTSLADTALVQGMTIQSDDKIIVTGEKLAARYDTNGNLDVSFDGDGIAVADWGATSTPVKIYDVAVQTNGRIVFAGAFDVGGTRASERLEAFGVARCNTDGSVDSSFGDDGLVTTSFAPNVDAAESVAVQADGRLVVVGRSCRDFSNDNLGPFCDVAVARYNGDGGLDASFDGDGIVTTDLGMASGALSVALQGDGKIVVGGTAYSANSSIGFGVVLRYSALGTLDTNFNGNGILTWAGVLASAESVAIQNDGKIVVGGEWDLRRYNADGTPDTGFDGDGIVELSLWYGHVGVNSLALQEDGKIVAVLDRLGEFDIARYNPDGSLDTSFGDNGIIMMPMGRADDEATDVAIQRDGKIVVVGGARDIEGDYDFAVVRMDPDGSLDTGFGDNGLVMTPLRARTDPFELYIDAARSVAIQTDGKIVVVGASWDSPVYDYAVVRYEADGRLDTTFGGSGIVLTDLGGSDDFASDMALQADQRIVVVGKREDAVKSQYYGETEFFVERYMFSCGNSVLDAGELCDDGNLTSGDGCDSNCTPTSCGNGVVTVGETCDDGNTVTGDCCAADCTFEDAYARCSDGNACTANDTCDGGGGCLSGGPLVCNDGNACNGVETCNTQIGCVAGTPCDDGNACNGVETCSTQTGCVAGTPLACDDGNVCNGTETCNPSSGCEGGASFDCDDGDPCTQDSCDDDTGCVNAFGPATTCREGNQTTLQILDSTDDAKDQIKWRWSRGPYFLQAVLGKPSSETTYTLCVYDSTDGTDTLAIRLKIEPNAFWLDKDPKGWRYKDKTGSANGLVKASLKTGLVLKSKVQIAAKGMNVPTLLRFSDSALFDQAPRVTVQLFNDATPEPTCWSSSVTAAIVNNATQFKAKAP